MTKGNLKNNDPATERTMEMPESQFLGRLVPVARAIPQQMYNSSYVPLEIQEFGFRRYHETEGDKYDRTKQEIISRLVSLGFRTDQSFVISSCTDIGTSLDSKITVIQSMEEPEKLEIMENEFPEGVYIARFIPNFLEIEKLPRITLEHGKFCIRTEVIYKPAMEPEIV